jgi:hypothetical protein
MSSQPVQTLPMRVVVNTWWPLAASWLLMGIELPLLSAVVARLPAPEINLAAYGGIVFPLALIIEAPIIMLLAASTALSKDWAAYQKLWRFMMVTSAILTGLHVLVAFTPLYYVVARQLLGVPEAIVEPGKLGLMLMTPWTWSIAFRRFNQGAMIRFGHSDAVGVGTIVRLLADCTVLAIGYLAGGAIPGIAVGAGAVAAGVMSEAVYAGLRIRPVLRQDIMPAPPAEPLTWKGFADFYIPLVWTAFLGLVWQPIGSAAISRMPQALESLAVWPVLAGVVFMLRSPGIAYNEVVVALLDRPGSSHNLRRFSTILLLASSAAHLLMAATPLAALWFGRLSALQPELADLARAGFWLALPLPAASVLQSWYQGAIMFSRRTGGIPESVVIFLLAVLAVLGSGIAWGGMTGLYVGMGGLVVANLAQTAWLWLRSRAVMQAVSQRDQEME